MTFLHPWALLLLLLMPAAFVALDGVERRRRARLERFGDPSLLARSSMLPDGASRRQRTRIRLIAFALLIVALARPQLGQRPSTLPHSGRDLLVLLDISRSMGSPDVPPSRMAAAKQAALDLLGQLPGDRVGLMVFGGAAFLQLPLVQDHATFKLFLDAASNQYLYDPSTDLAGALKAALAVFDHEGSHGSRAIVLLSDGETQPEGVLDVTPALERERIPVIAVGIGTAEGGPVPADTTEAPEKWHRDHIGRVVNSRLEEGVLIRLARETGGAYLRWRDGQGLNPLVERIRQVEVRALESTEAGTEQADRFQWPLAIGLFLLLTELVLSAGSGGIGLPRPATEAGRRGVAAPRPAPSKAGVALLLTATVLAIPGCTTATGEARRGEHDYAADKWREAYEAFDKASNAGAGRAAEYDAGNALYRMHHYEDAIKRYLNLPDDSTRIYRSARFNLGNAYVRAAEEMDDDHRDQPLRLAVAAFEEVLRTNPRDVEAKWNLELALRRLGDQSGDGSPNRGRRADYGRGQMDDPNKEGNDQAVVGAMAGGGYGSVEGESAKELTEEQARRLLESVQREQLQTHEGRPNGKGKPGGKDW
jgi:Ca-activated chloride channel family protein